MIKDIDRGELGPVGTRVYKLRMAAPVHYYAVITKTPNWKSQKTVRKGWRRLSNATKAVKRRMGFREARHA